MRDAPAFILAHRTATDVLLADGAAVLACTWRELSSSDGAEVMLEWSARVAPVDSAADRELLAEQFLGAGVGATLDSRASIAFFERSLASAVRRSIAGHAVATLLRGEADAALNQSFGDEAKRVGFSVGLAVMSPFTLRIESPSVQRERALSETRTRVAAMAEMDGARVRSIAALAQTLAELPEPTRAAQVLADLRLGDPLDLLRAAAIADSSWSAATPHLWIAAGDRIVAVDPTSPTIQVDQAIKIDGIGPLRSIRNDEIDGVSVLLVGGRGGVAVVDVAARRVRAIYPSNTTSDFGFNGACVLAGAGLLVATHSAMGVVTWPIEIPAITTAVGGSRTCRSPLRCGNDAILVIADGRAAEFTARGGLRMLDASPVDLAELERVDAHAFVGLTSSGDCHRADCRSLDAAWTPLDLQTRGGNSVAALDVCGTPRLVTLTADGGVRIADPHGGASLPVGPLRGVNGARLVRARPGFIASVSADRTRIALINLAKPDALAGEIHVAVALGHRAADCWFA